MPQECAEILLQVHWGQGRASGGFSRALSGRSEWLLAVGGFTGNLQSVKGRYWTGSAWLPMWRGDKLLHHAGSVTSEPMWVRLPAKQCSHKAAFVVSPLRWGESCFPSTWLSCRELFHGFLPDCLPYIKCSRVRSCWNQLCYMLLHVSAISTACLVGFAVEEQQLAELTIFKKKFLKETMDIRGK